MMPDLLYPLAAVSLIAGPCLIANAIDDLRAWRKRRR